MSDLYHHLDSTSKDPKSSVRSFGRGLAPDYLPFAFLTNAAARDPKCRVAFIRMTVVATGRTLPRQSPAGPNVPKTWELCMVAWHIN